MDVRNVLFSSWPIEPSRVQHRLPDSLDLDVYQDRAWLTVVALQASDVRPPWLPASLGIRLAQLNLRTYVTHPRGDGVYFLSLDTDSRLAVLGGRLLQSLPYCFAHIDLKERADSTWVESIRHHPGRRPATVRVAYEPNGGRPSMGSGSLAAFLVSRDRLFTETASGSIRSTRVEHDAWPLFGAAATVEENDLFRANDIVAPADDPVHFYSPGVEMVATRSRRPNWLG